MLNEFGLSLRRCNSTALTLIFYVYLYYGLFGRIWVSLDGSLVSGVSEVFFLFITNVKGTAREPQLHIKWQ